MYFVSVTRLRVRSIRFMLQFFRANEASIKAIRKSDGYLGGKELVDKSFTFWTVTVWDSDKAMKFFRNNDPHKTAMRNLPEWCNEGSYIHWLQESSEIPGWDILYSRMIAEGKLTKVKHPSLRHLDMSYPPPAWTKTERPILPAVK